MGPPEILRGFSEQQIMVAGDPMIDVYHFGHVDRLSPEAPVPVFVEDRVERRMGGAANVAANLEALGCLVATWFPPKPWTEKHRYLVGNHQLFRSDKDYLAEEMTEDEISLWPTGSFDAVVISDYRKGFCTPERIKTLRALAAMDHVPMVVDPKGGDWNKYPEEAVMCPNHLEFRAYEQHGPVRRVFERMVVKRGAEGMVVADNRTHSVLPAQAKHVFDVTGAGDTVVAVIAAALATGADLFQAALLANAAAGYVVGEVGTAVCPIHVLKTFFP